RRDAADVEEEIAALATMTEDALLLITADDGSGGVTATEHDEPHTVSDHIPLVHAGKDVTRRHQLTRPVSQLDIPATVLWRLGVDVPSCYEGAPLTDAFAPDVVGAPA